MVMPALSGKIKDLFGFEFSELLEEMGGEKEFQGKKPYRNEPARAQPRKRGKLGDEVAQIESAVDVIIGT